MTNLATYYARAIRYNSSHTEEDFHRKINENIHEMTAHLTYADWLEENGRGAEAEIIRSAANKFSPPTSSLYLPSVRTLTFGDRSHQELPSTIITHPHIEGSQERTGLHLFVPDKTDPNKDFVYQTTFPTEELKRIVGEAIKQGVSV